MIIVLLNKAIYFFHFILFGISQQLGRSSYLERDILKLLYWGTIALEKGSLNFFIA